MRRVVIRSLVLFATGWVALGLTACSPSLTPTAQDVTRAESLRPKSPDLAAKYERACMTCHTQVAAQAPLTGHIAAWQPRLKQGMDVLVQHAEQGMGAMPPRGLCADCSTDELRALTAFMANGQ